MLLTQHRTPICEVSGSHGQEYEDDYPLGCRAEVYQRSL